MAPSNIPKVILIHSTMAKTDANTQDEEDDVTDNTNSVHVSVASLGTKQTSSTNKSVIPMETPDTRASKQKRCRTQRTFHTPESSSKDASPSKSSQAKSTKRKKDVIQDDSDDDDEFFSEAEQKLMELKEKVNEDQYNTALIAEMNNAEKVFYKTLINLSLRLGPSIKWEGWVQGYVQIVTLTKQGEQYQKTESK
jgi:hypothetical protein